MNSRKDILLINTNRIRPPVGPLALDYLADSLREAGFTPRLLDLCFEENLESAIRNSLHASEPVLVGLTLRNTDDCYLASGQDFLASFLSLIALVKQRTAAPLVLGGSGFSIFPEAIMKLSGADFGLIGDGERPLTLLAERLVRNEDVSDVPGLVWWDDRTGRPSANSDSEENISSLHINDRAFFDPSQLPERSRSLVDNERYFHEGGQVGIETKRGCDRACIYCADPLSKGRKLRLRSPHQVADEFTLLAARGLDHFHLCDSEFNLPRAHALEVCAELIRRRLGERIRWYCYAKPPLDRALAEAMRKAGCIGINFGADAGDDAMLSNLGRDYTTVDLRETVHNCRTAGLTVMYDLLLGGPGETRASVRRTIIEMKRISPDRLGVSLGLRIYAGTKLAEMLSAQGPLDKNPNLRGVLTGNDDYRRPVFYLSTTLGDDAQSYLAELVAGDERFFFPTTEAGAEAYNYNDNQRLVDAITAGHRGAYWDILRKLRESDNPSA